MTSDEDNKAKDEFEKICTKYTTKGTILEFCNEGENYLSSLQGSPLINFIKKEVRATYVHYHNKSFAGITTKQFVEEIAGKVKKKLEELVKN